MIIRYIILFWFIFTMLACEQESDKTENNKLIVSNKDSISATELKANIPDTTNQYIYDFMKIVISDQKLNLNYGLTIQQELRCDLVQDDKVFLQTLLVQKSNLINDTNAWKIAAFNKLPKCLTKVDIDEMLEQKEKLSNFVWDNSRLGFNKSNDKNWYSFSMPLFSKDKRKAVMMIKDLCPGLCGTGWTVLFIKKNNNWTSKTGGQWLH